jgi:hypothetical protein
MVTHGNAHVYRVSPRSAPQTLIRFRGEVETTEYLNAFGATPESIQDISAFSTCE